MPTNENNLNYNEQPSVLRNILLFVGVVVIVFVVTIGVLMLFNSYKQDTPITTFDQTDKPKDEINNSTSNAISRQYGDVNLPVINQAELKQNYPENIKKIIANLEEQIQQAGGVEKLDAGKIQDVKKAVLQEVVPAEYQALHLEMILALDLMINGYGDIGWRKLQSENNKLQYFDTAQHKIPNNK